MQETRLRMVRLTHVSTRISKPCDHHVDNTTFHGTIVKPTSFNCLQIFKIRTKYVLSNIDVYPWSEDSEHSATASTSRKRRGELECDNWQIRIRGPPGRQGYFSTCNEVVGEQGLASHTERTFRGALTQPRRTILSLKPPRAPARHVSNATY